MPHNVSSALIAFELEGISAAFYLPSRGTPDRVKTALARACSHRRPIVRDRPRAYLGNVAYELRRISSADSVEIHGPLDPKKSNNLRYSYSIELNEHGVVTIYCNDLLGPRQQKRLYPFFRWLGVQWKRPSKLTRKLERKISGKRRGPASKLRKLGLLVPGETNIDQTNKPNNTFIRINERVEFDYSSEDFRRMRINFTDVIPTSLQPNPDYDAEHTRVEDASPI